jgi:glycosyl transferase family 25
MVDFRKFVINLESRPDRRSKMQKQLDEIGWQAEFIKAIRPEDRGPFPSLGARGCFLSHVELLRRGEGSNVILMEDDLSFVEGASRLWAAAVAKLPADWSIFYPAHDLGNGIIDPKTAVVCAHMVVFKDSIVSRILRELEIIMSRPAGHPMGGPMHVDGAYSTIRAQNPDIRTYAFSPSLGYQRSSRSDITTKNFFDGFPVLRPITSAVRKILR